MSSEHLDLEARYARLDQLYKVSQVIHSTLDPGKALQLVVDEAVRLMRATSGSLALQNPLNGLLEIQASKGLPPTANSIRLRPGEGMTGWVMRHGRPARSGNVTADTRYVNIIADVQSELAVPLEVDGQVKGVLNVDSNLPAAFSEDDQTLLEELARHAAHVIQNTWIFEQARLKARLLESLVRVSQTISSTLNLDDALRTITREAHRLMDARVCSLVMVDESGQWLDLRASCGAGEAYLTQPRLSVDDSLSGAVVRRKKPLQIENVQTSSRYENQFLAQHEGLVSLLSVPLVDGDVGVGALSIYKGFAYSFSNEEIRILTALAELSAIAIKKASLYERIVDVEEQLRESERLSALGLLAAEVAHEIRNPLTVMKMMFHSLDLRFPEGDPRQEDARIMAGKMEHLNRIVEQILDFARRTEPVLTPVNMNQLVEDLRLLTRHKLRHHQIELRHDLDPKLPSIMADPTQLEQAFLNLTLNAIEAMPKGGRLAIVTRSLKLPRKSARPTHVVISFQDTGVGFSPEQTRTAFTNLLNSTKKKGTGLGLALVARVVETHRGTIRLKSRPGVGATFRICLPVESPAVPAGGA